MKLIPTAPTVPPERLAEILADIVRVLLGMPVGGGERELDIISPEYQHSMEIAE